ncbi:MAG TPA: hypothetical protein VK427_27945 [Kofleriaceae bacterium]|nr:hypothetical protein [Kofleriaceae bacterium]
MKVAPGDVEADAFVRAKFANVAVPNAAADDKVALEITIEPVVEVAQRG